MLSSHEERDNKESPQPLNFVHVRTAISYLRGSFGELGRTILNDSGTPGVRYSYGPFAIEYYTGDQEPRIQPFWGLRLIFWDRVKVLTQPEGWIQPSNRGKLAPHAIVDLSIEKYWENWSHGTKNHRAKWFTQQEYEITVSDLETFVTYFRKHARPVYTISPSIVMMQRQIKEHGNRMHYFLLRNKQTGIVSAGICTIDYPEVSQSYYTSSFYAREHIPRQAGVWLLNFWFLQCRELEIPYANLGTVYAKGQPKSWKGFTEFKMYFRPFIVHCRPPLIRITFSLK